MHFCIYWVSMYKGYMSYHPRQNSLKGTVLNQCWILFPSPCLETSCIPCAANHLSQVPKPICNLEADLPFAEIAGFLHILLMGRSVSLIGIQKINRYFLFWKNTPGRGEARDEFFNWLGWQLFLPPFLFLFLFFFFDKFVYLFIYLFIFGCTVSLLLHTGFL